MSSPAAHKHSARITYPTALARQADALATSSPAMEDPALSVPRKRNLLLAPDPRQSISVYSPSDSRRLAADVLACTSNGSFLSRILRVITVDGQSKHFEMITGQDGLTFGITDFAGDSGSHRFFTEFYKRFPEDFVRLFGKDGEHLLDLDWLKAHNGGKGGRAGYGKSAANNRGLISEQWIRVGLARLLADPRYRAFQLEHFVNTKVAFSLRQFESLIGGRGVMREFTLATMVAMANSAPKYVLTHFHEALANVREGQGRAWEDQVTQAALSGYVRRDISEAKAKAKRGKRVNVEEVHRSVEALLAAGFGRSEQRPAAVDVDSHYARRAQQLFKYFSFTGEDTYRGLGSFAPVLWTVTPAPEYEPPPAGVEPPPAGANEEDLELVTELEEFVLVRPEQQSKAAPAPQPGATPTALASAPQVLNTAAAKPPQVSPEVLQEKALKTPAVAQEPAEEAAEEEEKDDRTTFEGLLRRNQRIARLIAAALDPKVGWIKMQSKDRAQIDELVKAGAYRFTKNKKPPNVDKTVCMSHELMDVLAALLRAPTTHSKDSFYILSLMREPSVYEGDPKHHGNHGRLFKKSPGKDRLGRPVTGISSGLDVGGYGGVLINLENIGPDDVKVPLTKEQLARFAELKRRTILGVSTVLSALPAGSYKLGLPVPAHADARRSGAEDLYVFLRTGMTIPKAMLSAKKREELEKKEAAGKSVQWPVIEPQKSPLGSYRKDLQLVYTEARAALSKAVDGNSAHPSIVCLFSDAVDHLHITALAPGDPR